MLLLVRRALLFGALSLIASRAGAEPLVFLPPVGDSPASSALGDLMHLRAEQLLVDGGAPAVSPSQHVVGAAELLHAPPSTWFGGPAPARIGRLLGAKRVVVSRLRAAAPGYTLEIQIVDDGRAGQATSTPLPAPLAATVLAGARALAQAALGVAPPKPPADRWPPSVPDRAVERYAACLAAVSRQPIVLDSPSLVRADELDAAISACRDALALAPNLDGAKATLGLALAIRDRAKEAVPVLAGVPTASYDPSLVLAHYWLATRYRSADDGLAVLREAVKRFPGSLLARVLLAEHLYVTRQDQAALDAWNQVMALAPKSSLTRSRVSAVLARLGKHDQAIALARDFAGQTPDDTADEITLASRFIDAGRNADAIATLEPIANDDASPKVFERLGRAYLRSGQLPKAQHAFERAHDASDRRSADWRTRGYALAGLLRVAAARRDDSLILELARQAKDEDYVAFLRASHDATIVAALDRLDAPDRAPATGKKPPRVEAIKYVRPSEATPFVLDPAGEVDPKGRAFQTPPSFLKVLTF